MWLLCLCFYLFLFLICIQFNSSCVPIAYCRTFLILCIDWLIDFFFFFFEGGGYAVPSHWESDKICQFVTCDHVTTVKGHSRNGGSTCTHLKPVTCFFYQFQTGALTRVAFMVRDWDTVSVSCFSNIGQSYLPPVCCVVSFLLSLNATYFKHASTSCSSTKAKPKVTTWLIDGQPVACLPEVHGPLHV